MGRQLGGPDPFRRKGPAGSGRRRKQERKVRQHSVKDAQQQLANLKRAQQEKLRKKNGAAAKSGAGKKAADEKSQQRPRGSDSEDSSAEDDGPKKKKRKKGASAPEPPAQSRSTGFEKAFAPEAPQTLPFKRCFWEGPMPEGEPDDALKQARKDLGLKVRGVPVPAPVSGPADAGLTPHFRQIFCGKQGGGLGLEKPTPIQAQVWPAALCGLDVIGIAPTGSGKTLAYLVPAVPHILGQAKPATAVPQHIVGKGKGRGTVCLVLVPTRELAKQVSDVCGGGSTGGWLKRLFDLRAGAVYGGTGKEVQLDSIVTLGAPQVLAATPGRLLDMLGLDVLSVAQVTYLVLDEADRMLALGFEPQLSAILKGVRPNCQALLFSATFPLKLRTAAEQWMSAQRVIIRVATMELTGADGQEVGRADEDDDEEADAERPEGQAAAGASPGAETSGPSTLTVSPTVHQAVEVCSNLKKPRILVRLLQKIRAEEAASGTRQRSAVLVFCSQIKVLRSMAKLVERQGERCAALHSGIPQAKREQALEDLKVGKVDTLVATDVASRGIHVGRLRHVVNFDFPRNLEVYCHRIGRVGRQGVEGWAHSFFTKEESQLAPGLASLLERCKQPVGARLRRLAEGRDPGLSEDSGAEQGPASAPAAASASTATGAEMRAGDHVRLHGLQSAPQLNGARGRLCRWLAENGRWEVILDGPKGDVKALKPESLALMGPRLQPGKLATGARVVLRGLNKAPQLNGLRAHVRRQVPRTDRWEVAIDDSADVKAVRADNLVVLKPPPVGGEASSSDEEEAGGEAESAATGAKGAAAEQQDAPQPPKPEPPAAAVEPTEEGAEDEGSDEEAEAEEEGEESEEEAGDPGMPKTSKPSQRKRRRQRDQRRQQQQQRQPAAQPVAPGRKHKRKREPKKKRQRAKAAAASKAGAR